MTPKVKPLAWREIDPGFRWVGTGHGFSCQVARLHMGGYEVVGQMISQRDFATKEAAQAYAQEAYAKAILGCLEV